MYQLIGCVFAFDCISLVSRVFCAPSFMRFVKAYGYSRGLGGCLSTRPIEVVVASDDAVSGEGYHLWPLTVPVGTLSCLLQYALHES